MKSLMESLKQAIKEEYQGTAFYADNLCDIIANNKAIVQDAEKEYGMSKEEIAWLQKHAKCIPAGGGFDGDGTDVLTYWSDNNVDVVELLKVTKRSKKLASIFPYEEEFAIDDIKDDLDSWEEANFDDGEIKNKKALNIFGKAVGINNPAAGGAWVVSGYDANAIVIFDERTPLVDKLLKSVEGFY